MKVDMAYLQDLLKNNLRMIPDFPKPGINFCDVTSWLQNPDCLRALSVVGSMNIPDGITKIVAIEARGFLVGMQLVSDLHVPLLLARKPHKLPVPTDTQTYSLEYGSDTLCLEKNVISSEDRVLIVDDLLATGGTINAVADILKRYHPQSIDAFVWIDLVSEGLYGRQRLLTAGIDTYSVIQV